MNARCRESLPTAALLLFCLASPLAAEDVERRFAQAVEPFAQGLWPSAEKELGEFVTGHPDHPRTRAAVYYLAESLVRQQKYAAALPLYRRLLELPDQDDLRRHARYRAGELAYLASDYEAAANEFATFRAAYPTDPLNAYASSYLGEIALARQDGTAAEAHFREVLKRYPQSPIADACRLGLGRAQQQQGQVEAARLTYEVLRHGDGKLSRQALVQLGLLLYASGDYAEAEQHFLKVIAGEADAPLVSRAHYWLGMTRVGLQRWDGARDALRIALESDQPPELAAATCFWLAESCRRSGCENEAVPLFARIRADWPDCEWTDDALLGQLRLAISGHGDGDVPALAGDFLAANPHSPLQSEIAECLGRWWLREQEYAQAAEVFETEVQRLLEHGREEGEAPVLAPADAARLRGFRYLLALALLGQQDHQHALATLDTVSPDAGEQDLARGVQLARAAALMGLGRFAEAVPLWEAGLADPPSGAEASRCRLQLALALAEVGRWDEALAEHAEQLQGGEDHTSLVPVTRRMAELAVAAQRVDDAIRLHESLAARNADPSAGAQAWMDLGWTCFAAGRCEEAAQAFGRVQEGEAADAAAAEASLMRGRSLERLGRKEPALEAYLGAAASLDAGQPAAAAMFEAARLQQEAGQQSQASELLSRLVEQHAGFPLRDAALYQLAWLLVEQGQEEQGDDLFRRLSCEFPDSKYWADAVYRQAERAARQGRGEDAEQLADRLIAASSSGGLRAHALYLKGQTAAAASRWTDVAEPLQRLLREFPESGLRAAACYWIAESLFRQTRYEDAGNWFRQAEAAAEGMPEEEWVAMIPLRRAQILMHSDEWDGAYRIAKEIDPRFAGRRQQYEVDYLIGRCLALRADFDGARERYERVIRSPEGGRTETAAMAQWMIGESYLHQRKLDEALKAFGRVESLYDYPRWKAAALLQSARCYQAKGESEQAARQLSRVLVEFPETEFAKEASQRLVQAEPVHGVEVRR